MDNFGDYVEEFEAAPVPAVSLYVSSTLEEFGGLRRLLQGLPGSLDVPVVVHNLDDSLSGPNGNDADSVIGRAFDKGLSPLAESDLLLLLLDSSAGGSPVGETRSHVEIEYDTALRNGCEVLVFERVPPSLIDVDTRLADFKEELRVTQTMGTLDHLSDALNFETIHDRLVKWLLESGRTQHASGLVALGDQFVVSSDRSWRDNRIAHLDCWVMGIPRLRDEAGTASLLERANDEWNEACAAFTLRSSNVMRLHLSRAIELRPLDGHARYWLARLMMIRAGDAGDWREVLKHAEIATRVFEDSGNESARAGLGHLVQAKAYRALGKLDGSTMAVRQALDCLGWHSEPHLEACYLELVAGSESVAGGHLYDAFVRYPPSFAFAEHELTELGRGIETYHRIRHRLLDETRSQIKAMHRFEIDVGRAILRADGRNESIKASLGLVGASTEVGGSPNDHEPAVKPVGNNDGLIRIADRTEDPVRLAGLGQSLSTLNHTRLVELERRVEFGYGLWVKATEAEEKLVEETRQARQAGLGICAFILAVIGMSALTRQMPGVIAGSLAWVVVVVTVAGLLWWNRHELESAAAVVERATLQLKVTAAEFEKLVGEFERDHTALRFYVPRTAEPHGDGKLWRLSSGSAVFSLVSNDALAPHIREIVGGLPARPPSAVRLYRATPRSGDDERSAQADRWRAYASDLAVAFDRR